MTREAQAHQTSVTLVMAPPTELFAGTDMTFKVRVSCPSNCSLQGDIVRIATEAGDAVAVVELVSFDGATNETDDFVVKAPLKPGEYTWRAIFASQEMAGILHEESSAPYSFVVKPHTTSMAVWDVPSPIAFSGKFKIKVGVRCSAE